ncbi:hypothetical protein VTN96DRAFT_6907 [Rasamsonia emersonii]
MRLEADAETPPHLDLVLDLDPLQADPLLQQTILSHSVTLSDMSLSSAKRKFPAVESDAAVAAADDNDDATSDTSGRFDDADESEFDNNNNNYNNNSNGYYLDDFHDARSDSVHSAKRRRSNDWPLRDEIAYDEHGMRIDLSSRRSATNGTGTGSPRSSSKDRRRGSPVLRVRRSRFIEGSMNDRVSEKPPSIFLREDAAMDDGKETKQDRQLGHRGSGIFRFGKAIASAFNPFGAWKGSQDGQKTQKEIMKERQARAEKAYAELKKSGYKGTTGAAGANKGNNGVDLQIADATFKAIQEKMDYKLSAGDSRQSSTGLSQDDAQTATGRTKETGRHETGFLKVKSFHDLRKRTSALSIPSIRNRDVSPVRPSHEDSHRPAQKRQSRKDLARQAKLLKKVSSLESKLERVRRELRELTQEDEPPVPTICLDDVHARRFVPGALPTLPSERVLQNQVGSTSEEADSGPEIARTKSPHPDNLVIDHSDLRARSVSPKPRKLSKSRATASKDSLSRKRKSSVAESGVNASAKASGGVQEDSQGNSTDCGKTDESTKRQTPRQVKSQKVGENDSPGSAGKARPEQVEAEDPHSQINKTREKQEASKPSLRSFKRSPGLTPSRQRLKATKSVRNLRLVNADADEEVSGQADTNNNNPQLKSHRSFYLQDQPHLEQNIAKVPVVTKGGYGCGGHGHGNDENIPPVPPVPKELLEKGARLSYPYANTKQTDDYESGDMLDSAATATAITSRSPEESRSKRVPSDFTWPDDIF